MRKILFSLLIAVFAASCSNSQQEELSTETVTNTASAEGAEKKDLPEITFDELEHDFGKITQGERVSHSFTFKNTGKANLIISGASGSCGCTVPEWPKQPLKPGDSGKIDVVFNSEGKAGMQEKTITVVTNCEPATRVLKIKTEIIVPEPAK